MLILISAAFLGLVHVFAGKLRFLHVVPRSRWLSFAGGTSVAYVFVHLLPELEKYQSMLESKTGTALLFLDHHAYLIALAGLVAFYGIERSTKQSRKETRVATGQDVSSLKMFWISIAAFASYNAAIGYLLTSEERRSLSSLFFFTIAIALHFVVNDYALREHHKHLYARYGRWLLCAAIIAGAVIGQLAEIRSTVLAVLISFLAGGIILNVLKEELPDERESRFSVFLIGVVGYAGLLLAT
jgi:zinc transporter ZupT